MYFGVEIGGTKIQVALGAQPGAIQKLWRGEVDRGAGGREICRQVLAAITELRSSLPTGAVRGIGVGFGGPVDLATQRTITSHQVAGWDDFPLAEYLHEQTGLPTVIANDADTAALGEAIAGAGRGVSPSFYITVGSGIGGGLILDGEIYPGCGRGAGEIGHLRFFYEKEALIGATQSRDWTTEEVASGFGITARVRRHGLNAALLERCRANPDDLTTRMIADAAAAGDPLACRVLREAIECLAKAICQTIALVCPRRIIIGGGVSLLGEAMFFAPLREATARLVFRPFAGLTTIVPAALGEEVVLHGAIALAASRFGDRQTTPGGIGKLSEEVPD